MNKSFESTVARWRLSPRIPECGCFVEGKQNVHTDPHDESESHDYSCCELAHDNFMTKVKVLIKVNTISEP